MNMRNAVKLLEDKVDIFHAHNEPSWFVTLVKEITDKPVILDMHDSYLARMTPQEEAERREEGEDVFRVTTEERNNAQLADALVFPGENFAQLVTGEFGLKQKSLVLPSYMLRRWYRYNCEEWLGGLVYEGRVDLPDETANHPGSRGFRYCDYLELANECKDSGIDFHIYTVRSDKEFKDTYAEYCFVHEPKEFDRLPKWMSRHDWALVGNVNYTPEWEVAFPNKLFEYIAACVPIVAMNAKACAEYVGEHGIGIGVKSLDELKERWHEHEQCRMNLIKMRQSVTMEAHIGELEKFYESVCRT